MFSIAPSAQVVLLACRVCDHLRQHRILRGISCRHVTLHCIALGSFTVLRCVNGLSPLIIGQVAAMIWAFGRSAGRTPSAGCAGFRAGRGPIYMRTCVCLSPPLLHFVIGQHPANPAPSHKNKGSNPARNPVLSLQGQPGFMHLRHRLHHHASPSGDTVSRTSTNQRG